MDSALKNNAPTVHYNRGRMPIRTISCDHLMECFLIILHISLDYILGRCDEPEGRLYKHQPKIGRGNPDMQKFVEMCFDPSSPMNARLKETLFKMLEENS